MTTTKTAAATKGLSVKAKALGYYVSRRQVGEAYARNGNAHRPTPKYTYEAMGPAGMLGSYHNHADAAELCNECAGDAQ